MGKTLLYILAAAIGFVTCVVSAILLFFGVLFIWGSGSASAQSGWMTTGLIQVVIGLLIGVMGIGSAVGLVFWARRQAAAAGAGGENVTLKIDLPGQVKLDSLKCKSCGGALTSDNIQMLSGAPVVTCPYCHSTYQMTEEPKW